MPDPKKNKSQLVPEYTPNNSDKIPEYIPISSGDDKYYSNTGIVNKGLDYKRPDLLGSLTFDQTNQDLENQRGLNQSITETTLNNLKTFGTKTASSVIGGAGYLIGTTNAISKALDPTQDAKISDITENPLVNLSETMDKFAEETFPNYESNDETENPYALRNFFDTVTNQGIRDAAPFLAGMFIEGAAIGKIVGTPFKLAQMRKIAALNGELADQAKITSKLLQKAPPEITQLIVNNGEAMMEADHTSEEVYKQSYQDSIDKGLSEDQSKAIAETAKNESFKNVYAMNMGILKINNLSTRSFFKSDLSSRRAYKQAVEDYSKLTSKFDKAGYIANKTWNYTSDPIKESAEELLQGGTSEAVKNRVKQGIQDGNLTPEELYTSAVDTLSETIKRAQTGEGVAEMVISSILSGPISIRQKIKESKDERLNSESRKSTYESSIKGEFDEIKDLTQIDPSIPTKQVLSEKGKELLNQARTYNDFENLKNAAIVLDDQSLYQIARDTQIANMSFGHFEAGLGEVLNTKIKDLSNEISKELKASGKNTIEDFATGKSISIEEYTASLKEKLKTYEDIYNTIEGQYNISNPSIRHAVFNNAINQKELKKRLSNTKPIIGESWLDYKSKNIKSNVKDIDAIVDVGNQLKALGGKLDPDSISKSIELNTILNDYKDLKNWQSNSPDLDIHNNLKNHKDKNKTQFYYDELKEQFKVLTNPNPNIPNEYIQDKIKQDEDKTKDFVSTIDPTTKDSIQNTSSNIPISNITTKKTSPKSNKDSEQEGLQELARLADLMDVPRTSKESTKKQETKSENKSLDGVNSNINFSVFEGIDIEKVHALYEDPFAGFSETSLNLEPTQEFDSKAIDDSISNTKSTNKDKSTENIISSIDKKVDEIKSIKAKIPLYVTNKFEKTIGNKIPVDIKTGETELLNQESLKLLLSLKQGDMVDSEIGFYYSSNKSDGAFLSYNEAKLANKEVSPKTLAIRIYKNGLKLGAIKNNQEDDINDVFNNIESNPELQNTIINTPLEVSDKWSGFIRSLANKDLPSNYKEIPFEDRAYLNSPSQVVGNKDFLVFTINKEGELYLPKKYTSKNFEYLGVKNKTDLIGKFNLKTKYPGVMYVLIKSPDGSIVPLQCNGEYITKENSNYVINEITKALDKKNKVDLKELIQKISPFVYLDKDKGLFINGSKIFYKGKEVSLQEMKDIVSKTYKPIDLKTITNKQLDEILKLNVPKSTSIQFIQPKITLNLSPLKSNNIIKENIKEEETTINDISTTNDNIPSIKFEITSTGLTIKDEFENEDLLNSQDLFDFDNIPKEVVSKYTQDTSIPTNLDINNETANVEDLKDLLKKYNKTIKDIDFNIKDISNYTIAELEQHIKCL